VITLEGTALSRGVARGTVITVRRAAARQVRPDEDGNPRARFDDARRQAEAELRRAIEALPEIGGPAADILRAHLALVSDPALVSEVESRIDRDHVTAFEALERAAAALTSRFEALGDPILRGRAADLRDVCDCIARHLGDRATADDLDPPEARVVFATDLTPGQVLKLAQHRPLAFVLERGAETSHAAILLRALAVPAVIRVLHATVLVRDGDTVLVDGNLGRVIVRPPAQASVSNLAKASADGFESDSSPAITRDGVTIAVTASISGAADAQRAMAAGADGIGLFRTEALFLASDVLPSEDGQYASYRDVFAAVGSRPVTVRLLDLGADKQPAALQLARESNPALGLRGVRLSFARPDLLVTQLRALRRAAVGGRLRLLLPMVTDVTDVERMREMIDRAPIEAPAVAFEIGVMVETPAAALMADELAAAADFLSIGTNDLTQYVLAVDRGNADLAALYQPLHPAVIRLVRVAIAASIRRRTPVAVCGEAASDPRAVALFVGMGVRELSVHPSAVPGIKTQVRRLSTDAARALVEEVAALPTAAAVAARIEAAQERETGQCTRDA
jgi:phosphoenolpyruvate-protein phosphotransferase